MFTILLDFAKKIQFLQICNFLQILKVEHKSFPMMYLLSYLNIKHGIQRGGVNLTPPQRILVFKYPSRDRVKRNFIYYFYIYTVPEFNEFQPCLKSPKNRFQLSAGLNLEKFNTILSEINHLSRGLNLSCGSNSLNSASGYINI